MTKLRLATVDDVPLMVEYGRAFHAESSFSQMQFGADKVAANLRHGIGHGFVALAIDDDEQVVGGVHGDVIEPWFSPDRMGIEYFLYVRPESRGSRAAFMLIKAWVHWCLACGAEQIRPATAATSEPADRMYMRLGFEKAGTLWVMNKGKT